MNNHRLFTLSVTLLVVTLISACSSQKTPVVPGGGEITDYASLLDGLRGTGATVEAAGTLSQPFFSPEANLITVNGQQVQVFEFDSTALADEAAKSVSADGGSIGTSMVTWVAAPHFYRAGRVIALYTGDDSSVIDVLRTAMGAQFAGR